MPAPNPALSVVIASMLPWPEARTSVEAVLPQVRRLGGELIVAFASPDRPPDADTHPDVRWLVGAGQTPFQLRAAGLAAATGDVVAVTEDHCCARGDWCERILEAHRRWPHTAIIGGPVENGATERLIDWALFFVANSPYLLPVVTGPCGWTPARRWQAPGRAALAPFLVARHTARIVARMMLRKRRFRREVALGAPLIAVVLAAHVVGEVTGLLFGPGDSPRHMR